MKIRTPEQKQHIVEWIAALRSGEYIQGRNHMASIIQAGPNPKYAHCCLGVAENLRGVPNAELINNSLPIFLTFGEYYGFNTENPQIGGRGSSYFTCAYQNDTNRKTFKEIADMLEQDFILADDADTNCG